MTSEHDLPRYYLGAIIGNGYMVPRDPGDFEEDVYNRMLTAADEGDAIAQAILHSFPITNYENRYTQSKHGVSLRKEKHAITLLHAHYPQSFKGKCLPHLQQRAQEGHFTAARLVTLLARERMLDPEFEIIDPGR